MKRIAVIANSVGSLLACLLVLVGVGTLLHPSTAGAAERGVNMHPLWPQADKDEVLRELDAARAAGMGEVRIDIPWSLLQPEQRGRYDAAFLKRADRFFEAVASRGMRVTGVILESPCWASSAPPDVKRDCSPGWFERGVTRYAPVNPKDFAKAASLVARRWAPTLNALEIWNEPDSTAFWRASDPIRAYVKLLRATYRPVKRAVPRIKVLAGSTAGSNVEFIAGMYKAGAKGKFDGLSIHPYNNDRHPLARVPAADIRWSFVQGVPAIRDLMVAKGDARKRLWLTELGFSTCTASDLQCVTPQEQADFTAKTLLMADAWSYVAAVDIYNMRNLGTDGAALEQNFGLLAADFTPKPVYLALQAL
ncbi:MAG TPA: hypothetical protein VGW38_28710, partial [Chloroflexota bacterium]|nr:hypothetical protein [Chloroflexota bacterium]